MEPQGRTVDEKLGWIASRAHGVITRAEARALAAGVTMQQLKTRIRNGLLIPVNRGVYRWGHSAPSLEADYLASVRACGEGSALSGLAAAHFLVIVRQRPAHPDVTTRTERRIAGIRTRRARQLDRRDVIVVRSIPVTSVPRTLVDIAADLTDAALARACHEAGVRYRTTPRDVGRVLERVPNRPGSRRLRRVIAGDVHVTLSRLERDFLRLLRQAGLPLPVTNRVSGGRRIDCRWPEFRLTVELDSYQFHNSRYAWEQDHQRRREARARGDEFRRFTWFDVVEEPGPMIAELRDLLGGNPA